MEMETYQEIWLTGSILLLSLKSAKDWACWSYNTKCNRKQGKDRMISVSELYIELAEMSFILPYITADLKIGYLTVGETPNWNMSLD